MKFLSSHTKLYAFTQKVDDPAWEFSSRHGGLDCRRPNEWQNISFPSSGICGTISILPGNVYSPDHRSYEGLLIIEPEYKKLINVAENCKLHDEESAKTKKRRKARERGMCTCEFEKGVSCWLMRPKVEKEEISSCCLR